jgi:hypothetical protein
VTSACADATPPLQTAAAGVVFTYPIDAQLDVPVGTHVVVTFSDPVVATAIGTCSGTGASVTGGFCVVGPSGPVAGTATVTGGGKSVVLAGATLEPGTKYDVYVRSEVAPTASNLKSGPLFSFTTRADRPRAAPPTLVAVNGSPVSPLGGFRPMYDSSTIRLVFSEPLAPGSVTAAAGSVQLVDVATSTPVPALVIGNGIHVAIDPTSDLTPGKTYNVVLGNQIRDLGGQPLAPTMVSVTPVVRMTDPRDGVTGPIKQVLRTRQPGDPGPAASRSGATPNVVEIDKPLIGKTTSQVLASTLAAELADPDVLSGPVDIPFTIRRGQRVRLSGLDVKLGGQIPAGLTTGDIQIEFLTDGGGRLYRNPYQPAAQRPENDRSPLFVDLSFDAAISAVDPTGNAVVAQTVMGVQATGTAIATDGVLAIEAVSSMDFGLLGITTAPTNVVLELITDPKAVVPVDTTPPTVVATVPDNGSSELSPDAGIEVIFSEPVDLDRLRAGGIQLQTTAGQPIGSEIESHGSAIVIRPLASLAYSSTYHIAFSDVADAAGNKLANQGQVGFATPGLVGTAAPLTVTAIHPGAACALTGGNASSPGRCAGGLAGDDLYKPFTMAANEPVEVAFSQPPLANTMVHGTACGAGTVRIEALDAGGACTGAVAGTFSPHDRGFSFVPDQPWAAGQRYRVTLVSGPDRNCNANELCGISGDAASFDPLAGTVGNKSGGPDLAIVFTGAAASNATFMVADASPATDVNGSGFQEGGELSRDDNRVMLRYVNHSGIIDSASFNTPDCSGVTTGLEGCMYLSGAMPVTLGELTTTCPLPGGASAPSCVPVTISPQAMYGTSVGIDAVALLTISTDTGTSVLRVREPASGPLTGYIIDKGGPTLVVALDLYMDAPDMSILLSTHDLHSKPLSVSLEGPVTFLPDGRIAIAAHNVADIPVSVGVDNSILGTGTVDLIVPAGEMRLQLVSPLLRGGRL